MALIEVRDLVFDYADKRAVDHVSFSIEAGTITALVGPNGAGKTSLLRCLATLEEPLAGTITIAGVDVAEAPRLAHAKLGFLQDFFGLYDTLTVRQNILYAAAALQMKPAEIDPAVERAIAAVNLGPQSGKPARQLSRGQRQRLAIARAIVHRPPVLLLDEPASGLDPEARRDLSNLLKLLQTYDTTIIVSSHILTELEDYSTDMMAMREGRITEMRRLGAGNTAASRYLLAVLGTPDAALAKLGELAGVANLRGDGAQIFFDFDGDERARAALLHAVVTAGIEVLEFRPGAENLEQLYFQTGQR
jgi:ABC-2 type transport system ATP-binding protein